MLAYYVEWHLRRQLAPLLFVDDDKDGARLQRRSPVQKAEVSADARAKAASKRNSEGLPVHSFRTLLRDLATLTLNDVEIAAHSDHFIPMLARPTRLQRRAFEHLGLDLSKGVAM